MPHIPFIKMHGTGNDFVIVDARARDITLSHKRIAELANRHTGIGFDQFIVLKTSTKADVLMQIINADGSEVSACGNATRCVGWLIAQEKNTTEVTIETAAGILQASLVHSLGTKSEASRPSEPSASGASSHGRAAGEPGDKHMVAVDIGEPKFGWQEIPMGGNVDTLNVPLNIENLSHPVAVNMGNPHAVFFVDTHARVDLHRLGPEIEHHQLFPERVNVSVARVLSSSLSKSHVQSVSEKYEPVGESAMSHASCDFQQKITEAIKLDVWERGAGVTLSCGTAACATLVAAVKRGLIKGRKANIQLPGGDLQIEWKNDNHVWMTGEVAESFRGEFTP